jgi:transcriptional regulator with XRE-family HTH domain
LIAVVKRQQILPTSGHADDIITSSLLPWYQYFANQKYCIKWYYKVDIDIAQWLVKETDKRGWSFRELGRRAGLTSATISRVITGASRSGWEFCRKIAIALNVPPENVFRLADLLPPEPKETAALREMIHLFSQLSFHDQECFVVFARAFIMIKSQKAAFPDRASLDQMDRRQNSIGS